MDITLFNHSSFQDETVFNVFFTLKLFQTNPDVNLDVDLFIFYD